MKMNKNMTNLLSNFSENNLVNKVTICFNLTRYLILTLAITCCTLVFANSALFNFTVICLADEIDENNTVISDEAQREEKYFYTADEKAWLFSAVAVGSIIGAIPFPFFNSRIGTRVSFTIYGFISSLSTIFLPTAAAINFPLLLFIRVLQGIGVGAVFSIQGSIVHEWASTNEAGLFIAFISCHHQLGEIFLMPIAGLFCESSIGWKGIYYLLGAMTLITFVIFFLFFRNSPRNHKNVSKLELSKICDGKNLSENHSNDNSKIPYLKIITDKSIIGVWVACIGTFTAFQLYLQYSPTYFNKVLKMNVSKTGFIGAIPFLGALVVKVVVGPLSDHLTFLSHTRRCQMFHTLSQFPMAVCLATLAWMPIESKTFAQILLTAAIMLSSLNVVGAFKSGQLQSRQYAHVVMTVITFISSGIALFLPFLVSKLAPNNTYEEWALIFYTIAILVCITTVIFILTCETEPRPWTNQISQRYPNDVKNSTNFERV